MVGREGSSLIFILKEMGLGDTRIPIRTLAPAKIERRYPVSRLGNVGYECEMNSLFREKISCQVKSASNRIEREFSKDRYDSLTKQEHD